MSDSDLHFLSVLLSYVVVVLSLGYFLFGPKSKNPLILFIALAVVGLLTNLDNILIAALCFVIAIIYVVAYLVYPLDLVGFIKCLPLKTRTWRTVIGEDKIPVLAAGENVHVVSELARRSELPGLIRGEKMDLLEIQVSCAGYVLNEPTLYFLVPRQVLNFCLEHENIKSGPPIFYLLNFETREYYKRTNANAYH